jgi:hypothetical protein
MATVSSLVSRYSERLAQDEELKKPAARIMCISQHFI